VLIPEQSFSSFGIEMVDLHSPTAPTIARKEAARAARKAYEKRKTRQVTATRVVRAASVTRAAPALSLSAQPLNRVAARVSEMPRGLLSEEARHENRRYAYFPSRSTPSASTDPLINMNAPSPARKARAHEIHEKAGSISSTFELLWPVRSDMKTRLPTKPA
jgi:hypothetical protein